MLKYYTIWWLLLVLWVQMYNRSASLAPNARSSYTCDVEVKKIYRLSVWLWARTTRVCTEAIVSFRSRYNSPPICLFSLWILQYTYACINYNQVVNIIRLCVKSYACWKQLCVTGRGLWKSSSTPSRWFSRCRASSRRWQDRCLVL